MLKVLIGLVLTFNIMSKPIIDIQRSNQLDMVEMLNDNDFSDVSIYELSINEAQAVFTHKIALDVFVLENSEWPLHLAFERVVNAFKIVQQCQVKLDPIRVISINDNRGRIKFKQAFRHLELNDSLLTFAKRLPKTQTIKTIFIEQFYEGISATSDPRKIHSEDHPLNDYVWISSEVQKRRYLKTRQKNFSPLAHELGHVLINITHGNMKTEHIMSDKAQLRNSTFLQTHCSKMKEHEFMQEI